MALGPRVDGIKCQRDLIGQHLGKRVSLLALHIFKGVAEAALGNTIAALFEYQIGKTVGDVVTFEEIKKKLPLGLSKLPVDSPLFLLGARSIPAGSRAFSVVCGAYQVPMPTYLWTTSVMYFVTSAFLAYGGSKLINIL